MQLLATLVFSVGIVTKQGTRERLAGRSWLAVTTPGSPRNTQFPLFPSWTAVMPQLNSKGHSFRKFFLLLLGGLTG